VDAKEPESEKNDSQPHAGTAGDNQDRYAGSHAVPCALLERSRHALEERDQKRENPQGGERTEANQGESPEWL
jgi:hypothetical protein